MMVQATQRHIVEGTSVVTDQESSRLLWLQHSSLLAGILFCRTVSTVDLDLPVHVDSTGTYYRY